MLTSILAKVEANVAGADDALLLDHLGFVAETNATNVFLVRRRRGAVVTPTTRACPEGITRTTVLELCAQRGVAVQVGDWTLTARLHRRRGVRAPGTMGGLTPVVAVDGRPIGTGEPGPVTAHADRGLRRADRAERDAGRRRVVADPRRPC